MIYKIIGNITDEILVEILEYFKKFNNIIFKNSNIYIALNNYKSLEDNNALLEIFKKEKEKDNIYLIEINENNLKNEPIEIVDWCKSNFVRLDKEKFAVENKDRINQMFGVLDIFEENLRQICLEKQKIKNENEYEKENENEIIMKGGLNGENEGK